MANRAVFNELPVREDPSLYQAFTSITGDFYYEDYSNGTGSGNSMPYKEYHLLVPEGKVATVHASMTADDWGVIRVTRMASSGFASINLDVFLINLTSDVDKPGVRGGHVRWSQSNTIKLPAGTYELRVVHTNADYKEGYNATNNVSLCNYSIDITYEDVANRVIHVDFVFTHRENQHFTVPTVSDSTNTDKVSIPCGYTFFGTGTVIKDNGTTYEFRVQSGGKRKDCKLKPIPSVTDLQNNFDATQWYDTCCPPTARSMSTTKEGTIKGFNFEFAYPTIRTGVKLHYGTYGNGSHGCISTDEKWSTICSDMQALKDAGVSSVGITVTYPAGGPTEEYPNQSYPNFNRNPKGEVTNQI